MEQENPKWHSRGYLPHFEAANAIQSLTFRLADSLPKHVLQTEYEKLDELTTRERVERQKHLEEYLDAGYGECYLRRPEIAGLVEAALYHFDGERYYLIAWVVMPNHVHAIIETMAVPLDKILHSWKSFTALEANRKLGRRGAFWYREYFDRYIRDEAHLRNVIEYVHQNPVVAGLVDRAEEWPFSSARLYL